MADQAERGFSSRQHQPPFAPSAREAGVLFRMSRVNRAAICIEGGAKRTTSFLVIPAQAGIQFCFSVVILSVAKDLASQP